MEQRLAVLFADVCGSARLYERLGDAEAERAVDRCVKRMERSAEGFRGRLVKGLGDEIMVAFDSAEAACQAAQDMQQRVSDLPPVSGVQLAIRIGFQVGPVKVSGQDISGDTVDTAARIVGMARSGQILTVATTVSVLPGHLRGDVRELPQSADNKDHALQLFEVCWQKAEDTIPPPAANPAAVPAARSAPAGPDAGLSAARLCLRYRGRAYLLDEKTPILSLGRDSGSDVVIEDRKASRHHARLERRGDRFFYVDRSTNGSYVALEGAQETMIRRAEIPLQGSGSICFGASVNDPASDCATFEYL